MNEYQAVLDAPDQPLELGLQELEALEAPGFWTGAFQGGLVVSTITMIGATTIT